jgi:ketosteroid isomerase-like protein
MKRIISVLAVGLFLVACQTQQTQAPEEPRKIADKEVMDTVRSFADAFAKGDRPAVDKLLDEQFLTTDSNGTIEGKARTLSYVGAFADASRSKFEFSDWSIRQFGEVVIAKYKQVTHYERADGKIKDYLGCGTAVLADRDGKLVLLSSHFTELPPERKTVEVSKEVLESYTGKYKSPVSGNLYEVKQANGKLVVGSTKKPDVTFEYSAMSETEFFYPGAKATIEFVKGDDGKVSHYVFRAPDEEPYQIERVE